MRVNYAPKHSRDHADSLNYYICTVQFIRLRIWRNVLRNGVFRLSLPFGPISSEWNVVETSHLVKIIPRRREVTQTH